jgi:hypothetical protein
VDQFGILGSYKKPRAFAEIERDFDLLWAENPLNAVKFNLYLRTIPRKVQLFDGSVTAEPQKGAELKHEPIMRMISLAVRQPQAFWDNVLLFVALGSWHDIFTMLQYDLVYNGWDNRKLDWNKFGDLILAGLGNANTVNLIKKYLPQIKAASACTTIESQSNNKIAKWICSLVFGGKTDKGATYAQYRRLKNSGNAHEWQKQISQGRFQEIDFDKVHGRALSLLVKSKFLKNQGLSEKYSKWITAPETKEVKYTGFVHELFENFSADSSVRATIDKQFETLVNKAKGSEDKAVPYIVVRDISGSMGSQCTGTKSTCYNVAKALALYFSEFLTGSFSGSYINFASDAEFCQWKGSTPSAKWSNDKSSYVGGTNFQSVINLFVRLKKQGIPEEDFPQGILCISDSEFNPAQLGQTNVEAALTTLRKGGFSQEFVDNFKICLWNLQSSYYGATTGKKFETHGAVKNVYYFSGYSGSVISFLTGEIETAEQLALKALDQEILNQVRV